MSLSEGQFEVHISAHMFSRLRELQRRAALSGRGDEMVTAFLRALLRLKSDSWDFGEPSYRLPAMRLQIRCAVVPPLIVHFGVSEDRPIVYVKGVESLTE